MRRVLNFYTSDSPRKGSVWFLVPGDTAVLCFSSWLSDLQGKNFFRFIASILFRGNQCGLLQIALSFLKQAVLLIIRMSRRHSINCPDNQLQAIWRFIFVSDLISASFRSVTGMCNSSSILTFLSHQHLSYFHSSRPEEPLINRTVL